MIRRGGEIRGEGEARRSDGGAPAGEAGGREPHLGRARGHHAFASRRAGRTRRTGVRARRRGQRRKRLETVFERSMGASFIDATTRVVFTRSLTAATAMTQILAAWSGTRLPAVKPPPWRLSRPPRRAHTGSRGPARRSFGEAPSAARSRSRGARHAPPRARGRRVRVGAGGLAAIGSRIVGAPRGRGRPNRPTSQRVAASSSR